MILEWIYLIVGVVSFCIVGYLILFTNTGHTTYWKGTNRWKDIR